MDNIKSLFVKFFGKLGSKTSHFLYAYLFAILAIIVQALLSPYPEFSNGTDLSLISILFVPIFFPAGLGWFLEKFWLIFINDDTDLSGWLLAGWLVYVVIFLSASLTKNIRMKKVLYFIFVFLLVLNFYGCTTNDWSGYGVGI